MCANYKRNANKKNRSKWYWIWDDWKARPAKSNQTPPFGHIEGETKATKITLLVLSLTWFSIFLMYARFQTLFAYRGFKSPLLHQLVCFSSFFFQILEQVLEFVLLHFFLFAFWFNFILRTLENFLHKFGLLTPHTRPDRFQSETLFLLISLLLHSPSCLFAFRSGDFAFSYEAKSKSLISFKHTSMHSFLPFVFSFLLFLYQLPFKSRVFTFLLLGFPYRNF